MIDKTGSFWTGDSADDIAEYLRAFAAGGYAVAQVVVCTCRCSGGAFKLEVDDAEGYARRTCLQCGVPHAMLDSDDIADEVKPVRLTCPCGAESFNIAVGYAVRENGDVRWVSIGCRCTRCGILGCPANWKIDYGPTDTLLTSA